jgi:hypothetical protein
MTLRNCNAGVEVYSRVDGWTRSNRIVFEAAQHGELPLEPLRFSVGRNVFELHDVAAKVCGLRRRAYSIAGKCLHERRGMTQDEAAALDAAATMVEAIRYRFDPFDYVWYEDDATELRQRFPRYSVLLSAIRSVFSSFHERFTARRGTT